MTPQDTLKPNWPRVKFGDVVRQVKDKVDPETAGLERYIAGEHMDTDDLRIRRWGTIDDGYLGPAFHMRFQPGQVLYGSRRTYLRKVAVPDFEGICANTTFVLESADPTVLLPELLPFIMQTDGFNDHSIKQSKGSVNPYVNFSDLAWYEFPLPPLDEQRRIAQLIQNVETVGSTYSAALTALNDLALSRIEDFIADFNKIGFHHSVEQLLSEDPANGISPQTNNEGKGFRTVSISAVSEGHFVTDGNIKYANVNPNRIFRYLVKEGDIFVVRGNGNRSLTGKCGISLESYDDLFYPDLLIRLRFDSKKLHPKFAVLQWNSPSIHRNLIARAKSTNGIWKVNGQDIRAHTLVVPPFSEQLRLLNEVTEIEQAQERLKSRYRALHVMKSHILEHQLNANS